MSLLKLSGVTKNFRGLCAVSNVDFQVEEGEFFCIIGPNGAGKTTLLNLICRLLPIDAGEIVFAGRPISSLGPNQVARMGIAKTFQVDKPFPGLTVRENVFVGAYFGSGQGKVGLHQANALVEEALENVGLRSKKGEPVSSLSLSERRKLELARALSMKPRLLLLDEIHAGLDHQEVKDITRLISRVNKDQGIAVVMIEHIMEAVMTLADRIMVLHYGRKIACDKPRQVTSSEEVIKAYLGTRYKQLKH